MISKEIREWGDLHGYSETDDIEEDEEYNPDEDYDQYLWRTEMEEYALWNS